MAQKNASCLPPKFREDNVPHLADLSDTNRANLAQNDDDFEPHTWENLIEIIGGNQFQQLKRYPSQLRRYLCWSSQIKQEYGNMSNFICQKRLHWVSPDDLENSLKPINATPFENPEDYKILYNDWPYAVPHDVTHLVVWLKTPLASAPDGNLLPAARVRVQGFVDETFVSPIKAKRGFSDGDTLVLWFKNWSALQSVGSLEHFHCLVKGADDETLDKWTTDRRSDV